MRAAGIVSTAAILLLAGCSAPEVALEPAALPTIGAPRVAVADAPSADPSEPTAITEADARRILTELEANNAIFWRWLIDSEVGEQPPDWARTALERTYVGELVQPLIDFLLDAHADKGGIHPLLVRPYEQYWPASIEILRNDLACPLLRLSWNTSGVEAPEADGKRGLEIVGLTRASPDATWRYSGIYDVDQSTEEDVHAELRTRNLCR